MAAAFLNRHNTICRRQARPVAQRGGLLGQVDVRCHNGQVVTKCKLATLRRCGTGGCVRCSCFRRPRPVFVALRDDDPASLGDRSEPVLAIVLLAGIATVLSTATAGRLIDDGSYDGLLIAVWTFIAGGIYGAVGYFVLGGLLDRGVKALGSQGTYRRSRHVLAFAAVPIALSLVLWPVKLAALRRGRLPHRRTRRRHRRPRVRGLLLVFVAWSVVLLVIGVRRSTAGRGRARSPRRALAVVIPVDRGARRSALL